jgi:NAD(P)-dependent dehydrogenase (short-subunit alcohol dehydrogenase family)
MSKLALITGANKGIGLETARQLGRQGFHVLIGARDAKAGQAAASKLRQEGITADALLIDVTAPASITAAAAEVSQKHQALDVLINNAGVLLDDTSKPPSGQSLDVWHRTFDANFFGVIAVTQAFLPLLRAAPAARIVNLSSILASLALHVDPKSPIYHSQSAAYNASKTALNAWTVSLAYELRESPIKVNAAHPGHVQTDMGGASAPMGIVDGAKTGVALATLGADGASGTFTHMGKALPW